MRQSRVQNSRRPSLRDRLGELLKKGTREKVKRNVRVENCIVGRKKVIKESTRFPRDLGKLQGIAKKRRGLFL